MKKVEKFDVITTPLQNSNLIEASAGTGKTHSIALLVMRLIVEKELQIQQILMVTFTKAAVAELEQRIRSFVKEAYDYANSENPDLLSGELAEIIDAGVAKHGKKRVVDLLRQSMLFLDETAIFTIHGFCQRTLTEYAFETYQPFESELITDTMQLVDEAVNRFWRERITTLNVDLLREVVHRDFTITGLKNNVKNRLKDFENNSTVKKNDDEVLEQINKAEVEIEQSYHKIQEYYDQNEVSITDAALKCSKGTVIYKSAGNRESFLDAYEKAKFSKNPSDYIIGFLPELEKLFIDYLETKPGVSELYNEYMNYLIEQAVEYAHTFIEKKKQKNGLLFYDDLIKNLHKALNGPNQEALIKVMNEKYKAVFIDEFHDTDKYQYEIFNTLFGGRSTIFLIGDPKQSIYGWRGADIDTYKYARDHVDHLFTMDKNYRSTTNYIEAVNLIYKNTVNPFCDNIIDYTSVGSGRDVGKLMRDGVEEKPISIITDEKVEDAYVQVARQINEVLTGNFTIVKDGKEEKVTPSDIAVLVRKNDEATSLKWQLVKLGIPSVAYDEAQVLQTDEARDVFYILSAMIKPEKSNINRALATPMTGLSNEELKTLNDDIELERFRTFAQTLNESGIYGAMMQFASTYQVRKNSLKKEKGERIISNFLQVSELLQKQEIEKSQTPEQLLSWMQRLLEGEKVSGDEYIQRVESDEDAVTLITIHKSKGLAFNIVFEPFLNMKPKDVPTTADPAELAESKDEQENRRLMYVALTRAVYKSYINITKSKSGKGTIHHFQDSIESLPDNLLENIERHDEPKKAFVIKEKAKQNDARIFSGKIDKSWRILSFSGLSQSHASFEREEKEYDPSAYDEFVFNQLPKGIVAGLFLHEIFENIDFIDPGTWELEVQKLGSKYNVMIDESNILLFNQLISNVLNANYKDEKEQFNLSSLTESQKIHELEFYYDLNKFQTGALKNLLDNIGIDHNSFSGAMHGFVDLFFEMNGKYYILDWKSNYLGNVIEAYSPAKLDAAMTASNYHLQYLIYTVAVKRFLENRLPDFDYNKHFGGVFYTFLRGMREGQTEGIYYNKPGRELIEKIDRIFG